MMKWEHIAIFVRVHDPLCNLLLCTSVTIDIKVPFLLLFFSLHLYTSSVSANIAFFPLALL